MVSCPVKTIDNSSVREGILIAFHIVCVYLCVHVNSWGAQFLTHTKVLNEIFFFLQRESTDDFDTFWRSVMFSIEQYVENNSSLESGKHGTLIIHNLSWSP